MPQPNGRQKIPLGRQKPVSTSRRKRRIRKIMPYRFASTGFITGYLHFSRDIRKNVECSFIPLADMTMIFFSKWKRLWYGVAEDWTPGFSHAKRILYHWVTTPWQWRLPVCSWYLLFTSRLFALHWSFGGLNSGIFTCEASTLPLSYNPLTYVRLLWVTVNYCDTYEFSMEKKI